MLKKLIKYFIPPTVVFIIHVALVLFRVYNQFPSIDIPMHFLGGASVAYTFASIMFLAKNKNLLGKNHSAINFLFVLSLVALIAIFWEFFEYILAATTNLRWQSEIADTMLDLLMGLIGAPAGFFISRFRS